jgi:hypothetical protein
MTLRWPWLTAIRGVGHGVAHVALGGQVTQVSVRRTATTSGRFWFQDGLPPWESAIVSLAGPAAELFTADDPDADHRTAVIDGGGLDDHGDWSTARALADEHGFALEDATEQAATLVLERWPVIEAVARALRGSKRGIVSRDRVREVLAR